MRFDDSLKTVLAADTSTALGARAAFRQLVDLIARRRVAAEPELIERLRLLARSVPAEARAAIARGLAMADPPLALVQLFAADEPQVAAAALRAARLAPEEWGALIAATGPLGRSVLRARADLPPSAVRALESFGAADYVLGHEAAEQEEGEAEIGEEPALAPQLAPQLVAVPEPLSQPEPDPAPEPAAERFEIADLVQRIEHFQRERGTAAPRPAAPPARVVAFRFESDAAGIIRWIDSGPRGAVIGLSLRHEEAAGMPCVDGIAAGAFRKRTAFADARLVVAGTSPLGGAWRISGAPVFDAGTGQFTGYRGAARRPRAEEDVAPAAAPQDPVRAEGLRRLVHELRTPTNAIAGFSELIERELLGPVPPVYRQRAAVIRTQVAGLIGAIEDLDLAARIEGDALDLRPAAVPLPPLLARVAEDLAPLAALRGSRLALSPAEGLAVAADTFAVERLVSRLLATLVSASAAGELVHLAAAAMPGDLVLLEFSRPHAFAGRDEAALLALDDELATDMDGGPLLGVGFALRLARNLAAELGGRLSLDAERLTLALPAALNGTMGQASTSTP